MSHANARLTVHGRLLLVHRVLCDGRPAAHVVKELGVSRKTALLWVNRYRHEGEAGLHERSGRPRTSPTRTPAHLEAHVLRARRELLAGPDAIADATGVPARTVTQILTRHDAPPLAALDPVTGQPIRAVCASAHRYEHAHPGSLVHVDVKKLGRIPDGGGWRAHGRSEEVKGRGIGYDFIHACIDDHSRYAYAEVLPDERAETCAGFLTRAAAAFAAAGITSIERVMTDNALAYRRSSAFRDAVSAVGAVQKFTRPHCPWTDGKVERFNRTLGIEWAYRQVFTSNTARATALTPWLTRDNTTRPHHALGRRPPITRPPDTNVMAEYTQGP